MTTYKRATGAHTTAKPLHRKRSLSLQKRAGIHTRRHQFSRISSREAYVPPTYEPMGYEEAVIRNIMNNSKGSNVADEAYALTSTLSSLSGNLKELQYRKGVAAGKLLYKVKSAARGYIYPEESVADLVRFFQSAGHKHVTYIAYPGNIQIKLHDKLGPNVGASLHIFEAGVISGFLSSAMLRYVDIKESSCVNDDGPYCRFVFDASGAGRSGNADPSSIDRLANHIAHNVRFTKSRRAVVKNEYYMLGSSLLFDDVYVDSVKSIAAYMGWSVGERLSRNGKRVKLSEMKYAIRLLNMGNPEIIASKPLHMQLSFNGASSRRQFVNISVAFINGLLSSGAGSAATAEAHTENGSYVVDIREKGPKG